MNRTNIDYILDIFKTLTSELPEQMMYREIGDSIELRTLDNSEGILPFDAKENGWRLIGCQMIEAA